MSMRIPRHLGFSFVKLCVELAPLKTAAEVVYKCPDPEYVQKARRKGAAGAKKNTSKFFETIAKNRHAKAKQGKY